MKMVDWDFIYNVTERLCKLGKNNRNVPKLHQVEPFRYFFTKGGKLKHDDLDEYDGKFTRREIIARYLLVSVVLDQGPDVIGVRDLLRHVTNNLYRQEVRIFHRPIDFFKDLGISIDEFLNKHESIKKIRSEEWARENNSIPARYNLFFAQSMRGLISTKQVLDYAIHRWGVPLCVPLLLENDLQKSDDESPNPLIDYLESHVSAEIMAKELKDNSRYGLGSAIGNKGCHLFAKMYISIFNLVKYKLEDSGWNGISYEIPLDSNAGRVLFRTGFLMEWATFKEYERWNVIQKGRGKGGEHHIRVTNIRGKKTHNIDKNSDIFLDYINITKEYLRTGKRPKNVEIQRIPNILVYNLHKEGYRYSIADFDDGLMYIGTRYCFNHENPNCRECPIRDVCVGYKKDDKLIRNYRT